MPSWATKAQGALKRFGENLRRSAETDPRLARALAQGYDLENPLVHGTNKVLPTDESLRALFATDDPVHALGYTGGGRWAGPAELKESKAKNPRVPVSGPNTVPLILKAKPLELPINYREPMPYYDNGEWLRKLGVNDPEEFRKFVVAENQKPSDRHVYATGYGPDNIWGMRAVELNPPNDWRRNLSGPSNTVQFYEWLDDPAFRQALSDRGIKALTFEHPHQVFDIKGKKPREIGFTSQGKATAILDPSVVRSPFAAFEEEGVGLMKKQGGLVQYSRSK